MRKYKKDKVDLLKLNIHQIIRHDIYIRVAKMLWDNGVRFDDLTTSNQTLMRALCKDTVIGAVPEPYVCNAFAYLRQWDTDFFDESIGPPNEKIIY